MKGANVKFVDNLFVMGWRNKFVILPVKFVINYYRKAFIAGR